MWIYCHPACLRHDPGRGHPESPARLAAVLQAIEAAQLPDLEWREAPVASRTQLLRAHGCDLVQTVLDTEVGPGGLRIDADTAMSADSAQAALRAAGAVCAAVDAVLAGHTRRAFCAVRPPGHHATHDAAMGFCLFNSIAVAALHALIEHRLERVAIVDFDVHHGNGTQDIVWNEPRVLYASTHQQALYPGTGQAGEHGGSGNIVNAPLHEGSDGSAMRHAYDTIVLPALDAFAPQLLLISAGFDAHALDPLAGLNLVANDYHWMTRQLVAVAERHADGRVVSTLEGGYSLTALREASVAHLRALGEPDA